jgi:hypothetical protein
MYAAVTTLVPISISLFSLAVSVGALWIQRNHDRKSVQPIIQVDFGDYENRIFVTIENAGVGPLIIKQVEVVDLSSGKRHPSIIDHMPRQPAGIDWTTFVKRLEDRAVSAQRRLTILELRKPDPFHPKFEAFKRDVRRALGNLKMTIRGSDIYGSPLAPYTDTMEWFHRTLENDYDSSKLTSAFNPADGTGAV